MQNNIAGQLARFASETKFSDLPDEVVAESKRILLDSLGCAIAAGGDRKGRIGIEYGRILGGDQSVATIFGSTHRSSTFGAAFANGELINALDFDAILPPGHVSPYVLPGALADVTRHKVGDHVAVGTMVDSCQHCDQCHKGEEQLCREGNTQTFAGADRITGEPTMGGYSKHIVVREEFVLQMPEGLDLAKVGPLLCAGATTYSPLRTWNVGSGSRVGVVGMGGLGHMAIKLASAMGARVTVLSRSPAKANDAKELGADTFLVSSDAAAMEQAASSFDLIIDTVPTKHDLDPYIPLLDVDGTLCVVGQVGPLAEMNSISLLLGRRRVAGSAIAGIAQTQEMLEFCARKNVLPEVEMIRMDQINEAYERLERSDVRYRFVIDMASLKEPQSKSV